VYVTISELHSFYRERKEIRETRARL